MTQAELKQRYAEILELPKEVRLQLIELLWESIASERESLPLSEAKRAWLDQELAAYEADGDPGRPFEEVLARWQKSRNAPG